MVKIPTIIEEDSSRENFRAQWWRRNVVKLTVPELAELIGYTAQVIYLMERGINSTGLRVRPWAWRRYKLACAAVHTQIMTDAKFDWGKE